MKRLIILLTIIMLVGCATAPKFRAPDPFQSAQLAVATTVTMDPALKPVILQAVKEAQALVDKDLIGAINLVLNRIAQAQKYAPLVTAAMLVILDNANDLKLRPELVLKAQTMLANLEVILGQ